MSDKIFEIRPLNEEDYDTYLSKWWSDWGWTAPVKDFLPDSGKGGIMVLDDGEPICAGFLYLTNSKVSWVDFIISNKEYRKKPHRRNAIGLLIETLTNLAERNGSKFCYALIKHKSLQETYKTLGYTMGDSYTSEMIKSL